MVAKDAEKKENWFKRHPILSLIIGFFVFLIILGAMNSDAPADINTNQDNLNEEIDQTQYDEIVNLNDIMVQDSKVPTEWQVKIINDTESHFKKTYGRSVGFNTFQYVSIELEKFDSVRDSELEFNDITEPIIERRGYTELNLDAPFPCFGINTAQGTYQIICHKENVLLTIEGYGSGIYIDTVIEFFEWQRNAMLMK